jgi:SAM-dependent methyltransferase
MEQVTGIGGIVFAAADPARLPHDVRNAYARRAAEYTEQLGSMASVHPADRQLVSGWADTMTGPVIDAGCGPGHWTRYLADRGVAARGVDQVPAFIEHARAAHPGVPFKVGSVDDLADAAGSVDGVLAWYSLIHHHPAAIRRPLREFARVLRPGGGLVLGFFEGPRVERFDHLVVAAYRWPVADLSARLGEAGFEVLEVQTRTDAGQRPHGAIVARRAGGPPAERQDRAASTATPGPVSSEQ